MGSVYFGPLQAPYFRNVKRMGLSTDPLIRPLIVYNKLRYPNLSLGIMMAKSLSSTILIQSLTHEFFIHVCFSFPFLKFFNCEGTIQKTTSKPFP